MERVQKRNPDLPRSSGLSAADELCRSGAIVPTLLAASSSLEVRLHPLEYYDGIADREELPRAPLAA